MNKKNTLLISLLIFFTIGCKKQSKIFTESDAVIELNATRQSDLMNDYLGYMGMSTKNGSFWDNVFPEVNGLPDSLNDVTIHYTWLNNIQALYQAYKAGKVEKADFENYYKALGADTTECTADYVKTFVVIATGVSTSGQRYYFFDSNNNYDMADEIPFETVVVPADSYGNNNKEFQPHKIIYEKHLNGEILQDSTWIAFYERTDRMWIQFSEKSTARFQFDSLNCKIEARPSISKRYRGGAKFTVSLGFNKRSNQYTQGEYMQLGNAYYQIGCSSDGLKILLTKDEQVLSKGSTQVGLPPLSFSAESLTGDTVNFPGDFKGKYVLLDFWSLSCGPCIQEIRDYYIDIYEKYGGNQFEIIGVADNNAQQLESFINKFGIKWIVIPDGQHKEIHKKYNILHHPTLYFINPEGEIIAKEDDLRGGKFVTILDKNL